MNLLGVDPGAERSGVVSIKPDRTVLTADGSMKNDDVLNLISAARDTVIVCETFSSIDRRAGEDVFETLMWIGEFRHASRMMRGNKWVQIKMEESKRAIIGTKSGKWSLVCDELKRRYSHGVTDKKDAKKIAVGTAKFPGPLWGVVDHAWPALSVVTAYLDSLKGETNGNLVSRGS